MKRKMLKLFGVILLAIFLMAGCSNANSAKKTPTKDVVVLYTSDTHSYINNEKKDDDGNVTKQLSFASVKALKDELIAQGNDVLLADAGDHTQGTAYGGIDEGETIIKLMNAVGYDVATVGNHEFDYGMPRLFTLAGNAEFPYISSNFYSLENDATVFDPYKVIEAGGVKIAFVGVSTPESVNSSTPAVFLNDKGEFLYNFYAGENGKDMYQKFQESVDKARKEADYVIGLGHLGNDLYSKPFRSRDLIENISGIDVFIDGHSHNTFESEIIKDAKGNDVILSQAGNYFSDIGKLTITKEGKISTVLIKDYSGRDAEIDAMASDWVKKVDDRLGEKIAVVDSPLYVTNAKDSKERLVRITETNMGDFVPDAFYYYFNNVLKEPIDFSINNAGGIRADVKKGDATYMTVKTVNPFGNVLCVIEATGQQILDELEFGATMIGETNADTGKPAEFAGFTQVAGLKYTIDTSIKSTVQYYEDNSWKGAPTGEYRVKDVQVYNKETGTYEPLDPNKTYRIGGINYVLRNQGDGMKMFTDCKCVVDYVTQDYLALAEYMKAFTKENGYATIKTANSPLKSYKGYLLDYENPLGSGRITIIAN